MSEQEKTQGFDGWAILGAEEWRPVAGFEGLYQVSNQARVQRVGKAAVKGQGQGGGARIGRILKQHTINGGYGVVQLWRDGSPKTCLVHVLVAAAFLGPAPAGHEVNHKKRRQAKQHAEQPGIPHAR